MACNKDALRTQVHLRDPCSLPGESSLFTRSTQPPARSAPETRGDAPSWLSTHQRLLLNVVLASKARFWLATKAGA